MAFVFFAVLAAAGALVAVLGLVAINVSSYCIAAAQCGAIEETISATAHAPLQEILSGVIAESFGAPVVSLERLDAAMPRHVHHPEDVGAVLERRGHEAGA